MMWWGVRRVVVEWGGRVEIVMEEGVRRMAVLLRCGVECDGRKLSLSLLRISKRGRAW